jgi:hypothetical protein
VTPNDDFLLDPFANDPELEAMAREFRQALREEQEEIEAISAEEFEAEIDMTFAFLELMWSGAQTRISVGDSFFEGLITHVGKDLVQLATGPGTTVDVQIPFVSNVFIVDRHIGKGRAAFQRDPRTFIARMRELSSFPMQEVELGTDSTAASVSGILKFVRSDHLVVTNREKKEWLIPLANIGYCLTRAKVR